MSKYVKKQHKATDYVVDLALNGRDGTDLDRAYDLDALEPQIMAARRVIQPIICEMRLVSGKESEGEKLVVLAGNRRVLTAQRIVAKADCPADVLANLSKMECLVYSDLDDEERYSFIFDQGSQKPLSKAEIALGVWRMYSESYFNTNEARRKILMIQWQNLAAFSGSDSEIKAKLAKVDKNDRAARLAVLQGHYHGTLDNVLLGVYAMGPFCKEQFILTLKEEQGLLKSDEKVTMRMKRVRITELSKAKNKDKKEGQGWNPVDGGKEFNLLIEKFKEEDASGIKPKASTRPSVDDLLKKADNYAVTAVAKAIKLAAGVTGPQVAGLEEDCDRLYRNEKVIELLTKGAKEFAAEFRPLVNAILGMSPAKFQEFLRDEFKINVDL